MTFQPGRSCDPNGRPVGSCNRRTDNIFVRLENRGDTDCRTRISGFNWGAGLGTMQKPQVPYRRARVAKPSRRETLGLALAAAAAFAAGSSRARAAGDFSQWVAAFRAKALGRGISGDTYDRVMGGLRPDTTGLEAIRNQPEFNEQLWQYLNRRVSDWRIIAGME